MSWCFWEQLTDCTRFLPRCSWEQFRFHYREEIYATVNAKKSEDVETEYVLQNVVLKSQEAFEKYMKIEKGFVSGISGSWDICAPSQYFNSKIRPFFKTRCWQWWARFAITFFFTFCNEADFLRYNSFDATVPILWPRSYKKGVSVLVLNLH